MSIFSSVVSLTSRPDILGIYAGIIARIATASNLLAQTDRQDSSLLEVTQQPNQDEAAYLRDGAPGIIELVCHELREMGFVETHGAEIRVATYFKNTSHLEPLEQVIFDYLHVPRTTIALAEDRDLHKAIATFCDGYRTALIKKGYLQSDHKKYLIGASGLAIIALATLKPISGMLANYRYLMMLATVAMPKASLAIAATAWFTTRPKSHKLTAKGKAYLDAAYLQPFSVE